MHINEQELALAVSEALSNLANKGLDIGSYCSRPSDIDGAQFALEHRSNTNDWLDSTAAANHLGYATDTLRNARSTGFLGGIAAPLYVKRGSRVYYRRSTLNAWLAQFSEQARTSGVFA